MPEFAYTKKITAGIGWLRPLTEVRDNDGQILRPKGDPVPLMRIGGEVEEGAEEASEYGNFVRWRGRFRADVVQKDGSIKQYASMNLILPSVASDFIATMMKREMRQLGERKSVDKRTGLFYVPGGDLPEGADAASDAGKAFLAVKFIGDLWIKPPEGDKQSQTGYEFEWRVVTQDSRFNTMANLLASDTPLLPAPETQEAASEPQSGEAEHKRGNRRHAA